MVVAESGRVGVEMDSGGGLAARTCTVSKQANFRCYRRPDFADHEHLGSSEPSKWRRLSSVHGRYCHDIRGPNSCSLVHKCIDRTVSRFLELDMTRHDIPTL